MKFKKIAYYLMCFVMINISCKANNHLSQKEKAFLVKKIDSIYDLDQSARLAHFDLDTKYNLEKGSFIYVNQEKIKTALKDKYDSYKYSVDSIWTKMKSDDFKNTELLINLTKKYGFPSNERLNQYKSKAYWIFVHSPNKYFKEIENLVENEFKKGNLSDYKRQYIFWHIHGRQGMPPMAGENGEAIWQ